MNKNKRTRPLRTERRNQIILGDVRTVMAELPEQSIDAVITSPRHPYTAGLLASVPAEHVPGSRLPQVPGSAPSLADLPPGCAFAPRCPKAAPACNTPPPVQQFEDGRTALCHYPITLDPR